MARSVEDIHFVLNILSLGSVVELHHRRGDGDTTLLLNVHPVAGGRLLNLIAFHGTGNLYLSAKEQELLCQRGLTGIGVRNNCKRSSSFDLLIHRIIFTILMNYNLFNHLRFNDWRSALIIICRILYLHQPFDTFA